MQEDKGSRDTVNVNISLTDSSSMLTLAASPSKDPTNKPQSFQPPALKTSNLLHLHILSGADMMMVVLLMKMTRVRKDRMLMMGLAAKALPCVLPPLEQLQLRPPPARAHKSFNGCAAQLPLITASAATLLNMSSHIAKTKPCHT